MFHLNKLMNRKLIIFVSHEHEHCIFLSLHHEYLLITRIKQRQFIIKIINLQLIHAFLRLHFYDIATKKLYHLLGSLKLIIILLLSLSLNIAFETMFIFCRF